MTKKIKFLSFLLLLIFNQWVFANTTDIHIGVLSHRGDTATAISWGITAEYLTQQLPNYNFIVVPLDFDEIEQKIINRDIHFLLVNPSIYVVMEVRHRIRRIATLNRVINNDYFNQFGGVLFTKKSHSNIQHVNDVKGKHLLAVDPTSLGGYQMIIKELVDNGLKPESDLTISYAGIHDDVVMGILNDKADIGTVRTGILESMQQSGLIDLNDIHIINQKLDDGFKQLHSTQLYPEWPFSKLPHTSDELAQNVAIALMKMPHIKTVNGVKSFQSRWTIPLEYQPVHKILQSLRLAPYDEVVSFTIFDALKKYWYVILSTITFFILLAVITILVIRLNKELHTSKQRLERQHSLILDSVADGIYGVDLEGNSTFVNKAMENLTGWTSSNIIGKNQHEILHHTRANGELHPKKDCPVYKTFMDNKSRFIDEDIFWKSDGTSFPVEYSSTPIKDENNNTVGSVVIFRDISERIKAKKQAREFRNELAHIARVNTMGEMASGMAHELNQPLTAISTNADACIRLSESPNFDKNHLIDILENISSQAKRAGAIIQQLRNFIRKDMPDVKPVNINDIIQEVLILLKYSINENNIKVISNLQEPSPVIGAQHIQIDQVILNLIKNAIDSMTSLSIKNRKLTIKTELDENNLVQVSVGDNGKGIDEKIIKHLFSPFVTSKKSGLGLGLSISESIINQHNGKLILKSSNDQGALFQFSLPSFNEDKSNG